MSNEQQLNEIVVMQNMLKSMSEKSYEVIKAIEYLDDRFCEVILEMYGEVL